LRMGSRIVRNITGKLQDISALRDLDHFRKQFSSVRETAYLKDFAALKTFDKISNPKYIIRDTLITYLRNVCDIYKQSDLLQVLIFTFYDDGALYTFEYSNNMMFSDDITILCFLYVTLHYPCKYETMQVLMSLMKNKYGIHIEGKMDNTESTQEHNRITLADIAFSYPSIAWSMSIKMGLYSKLFRKFSDFNIPKAFCLPTIGHVLPILNEEPPFAILLLIALKTLEYNKFDIESTSLYTVFSDIYMSLVCTLFPQRLKLELCKKWQIVTTDERKKRYKYVPCFKAYHQEAKNMIAKMKPNDLGLESILSRL